MNNIEFLVAIILLGAISIGVFVCVIPLSLFELDKMVNTKQEIVEERFIVEYRSINIGVYHDNELNVTCYTITNTGLSCILDAEIGRR